MSYGEFESEGHRDRCALIGLLVSRALGMPGAAPIEIEEKVVAQRKGKGRVVQGWWRWDMKKTGTPESPITLQEANELRETAIKELQAAHNMEVIPVFTCETCYMIAWCEFAYDHYNTDGDCVADK